MRFCMGAENAKMKSAEKSAETGGHHFLRSVFSTERRIQVRFRMEGRNRQQKR
jgi:hypothetical protein